MSVAGGRLEAQAPGVPLRMLMVCQGHTVAIELTTGDVFRGHLEHVDGDMNLTLTDVVHKSTLSKEVKKLDNA
jgi:small nuclear ribonucleoprotein (snRNP)-like protein